VWVNRSSVLPLKFTNIRCAAAAPAMVVSSQRFTRHPSAFGQYHTPMPR
jgi:hypothetical protein